MSQTTESPYRVSKGSVQEIELALERYRAEVGRASLADNTKDTYLLHANNFVRWLKREFEPGVRSRL